MITTFDRYLFQRFLHAFAVFFFASFGLFVVVDAFTNLDDHQRATAHQGTAALLTRLVSHYALQSSLIFDLIGPTLGSVAVMTVLAMMIKQGELYPILAAGVPTYRLARPFLMGVILVNAGLVFNQEWIIPRIADQLLTNENSGPKAPDPQYDGHWIYVSGQQIFPAQHSLHQAEFRLPGELAEDKVVLKATEAYYFPSTGRRPAGWLLKGVQPPFAELRLTEKGRKIVRAQTNAQRLFVLSDLTFERLSHQAAHRYLSTPELVSRIRQPAGSVVAARAQIMNLHARFTRPLLNIIGVFLALPLIVRREKDNQVYNIALSMAVSSLVFGIWLGFQLLGQTPLLIEPEWAAMAPLIFGGTLCAWLTGTVRT